MKCLCELCLATYINDESSWTSDEVAEWLRRWTANPLRSTCVGSNPILVVIFVLVRSYEPRNEIILGRRHSNVTAWSVLVFTGALNYLLPMTSLVIRHPD